MCKMDNHIVVSAQRRTLPTGQLAIKTAGATDITEVIGHMAQALYKEIIISYNQYRHNNQPLFHWATGPEKTPPRRLRY